MNDAQLRAYDNAANAINKRLISIAKTYGISHPAYQSYVNKLSMEHIPIRYNAEGVIQIKRGGQVSEYQAARVKHLKEQGTSVQKERSKQRKRRAKKGQPKVSTAELDKEIKQRAARQQEINNTLDTIYKYITEGILPTDLYDKYQHFKDHDTSNDEIDEMIADIKQFENELRPKLKEITDKLHELPYLSEGIMQDIWEANSGRLNMDELTAAIDRMEQYYNERIAEGDE